jgi:tRNA(fMet)-specific endonuclease VapC
MAAPIGYLLDTNILVHVIRGKATGQAIDANFGLRAMLNRCVISVVSVGEMYSLARFWKWGPKKRAQLQGLLGQVAWIDINHPELLEAYGEIDNLSSAIGRSMGKNDVWIAATTKVAGIILLTTDGDFDHLHPAHLTRIRIDAKTGAAIL